MLNTNLEKISNFISQNDSFSDYENLNKLMNNLNLNYTKLNIKSKINKQMGGDIINNGINTQDSIPSNLAQTNMFPITPNSYNSHNEPINSNTLNTILPNIPNIPNTPNLYNDPNVLNNTNPIPMNSPNLYNDPNVLNNTNPIPMNSPNLYNDPNVLNNDPNVLNNDPNVLNNNTPNLLISTKPEYTSDNVETYTIPEGTILYHATTNKKGYNTNYLKFGKDKIINFFTPNFNLATSGIKNCSIDNQNGYIHVFKVKKSIPNIYIKLPYDITDDLDTEKLSDEFCSQSQKYYGIGFFYPKNNIEMFISGKNYNTTTTRFVNT